MIFKGVDYMNCVKCGNPLVEGNNFCMICGTPAGASVQTPAPAAVPGTAPAPGPSQDQVPLAPVEINPQTVAQAQAQAQVPPPPKAPVIPYAPPMVDAANNIIIPVGRKFRVYCPDCRHLSDDIKRDATAGFPCPVCKKAYAYGGQVLIYRMGNGMPSCAMLHVEITIDGLVYGEINNRESVRIMLSNGTHVIGMTSKPAWPYRPNHSNQFQIVIGPQSNNLAFKLSIVYRYSASAGLELVQCAPEEVPEI